MDTVIVAAARAAPVLLNRAATLGKVVDLAEKAATSGAKLVVFPETFLPGYPDWVWRTTPWDKHATALHSLLLDQAVVVGDDTTERIGETAQRLGVWLAIGIDERDPGGSTLYNTLLYFGPNGRLAGRHRKLVPTGGERLVWGRGDGSTLPVVETSFGRVSGLICWENYMPLARAALYSRGVDIYLAPTWDDADAWVATMRHIAKEGRCFVIGVNSCIRGSDVPADLPGRDDLYGGDDDWLSRGRSVIIDPNSDVLAGPIADREEILLAELDLGLIQRSRQQLDPAGHYTRPDVFTLTVDTTPQLGVRFADHH